MGGIWRQNNPKGACSISYPFSKYPQNMVVGVLCVCVCGACIKILKKVLFTNPLGWNQVFRIRGAGPGCGETEFPSEH